MKRAEEAYVEQWASGFTVTLEMGSDANFHYGLKVIKPYLMELRIALPPGKTKPYWLYGIQKIIKQVERGALWKVNFLYENFSPFFTLSDLSVLENCLLGVSVAAYDVPKTSEDIQVEQKTKSLYSKMKYRERNLDRLVLKIRNAYGFSDKEPKALAAAMEKRLEGVYYAPKHKPKLLQDLNKLLKNITAYNELQDAYFRIVAKPCCSTLLEPVGEGDAIACLLDGQMSFPI